MPACLLEDRGIIRVAGEDARSFLQGVVTCNMDKVVPGKAGYGALLTPQGKIIADFFVVEMDRAAASQLNTTPPGFLLDCPRHLAETLLKRLSMYKLRARVTLDALSGSKPNEPGKLSVVAQFGEKFVRQSPAAECPDPRAGALGIRAIMWRNAAEVVTDVRANKDDREGILSADVSVYEAHRIALGIPKGGEDFAYGETFPHEANMDLLHGLDFRKGCYVGQEVVSRVEHRGLARKRICRIEHPGRKAPQGARIFAGDKEIGEVGSGILGMSLAMVRLDRWDEARAAGLEVRVEDGPVVETVRAPV
jgi:folate-binding protein YgfZ